MKNDKVSINSVKFEYLLNRKYYHQYLCAFKKWNCIKIRNPLTVAQTSKANCCFHNNVTVNDTVTQSSNCYIVKVD